MSRPAFFPSAGRGPSKRLFFMLGCLLFPGMLLAPPPAWWAQTGTTTANPADDYAVANVGQLKHFAAKATEELDAKFPGGAGNDLADLITAWSFPAAPGVTRDDYAAVTLGQLKAVAKLFYDRLISKSYPIQHPWTGSTQPADDYATANLGQLKRVFSFDIGFDTDGDTFPDFWENFYNFNPNQWDAGTDDSDGDGLTNAQEFQFRSNPRDGDTDDDGLPDQWENTYGMNPNVPEDAYTDADADGMVALSEFEDGSDPNDSYNGLRPPGVPATPANPIANFSENGSILISWDDESDNEEYFVIRAIEGSSVRDLGRAPRDADSIEFATPGVPYSSSIFVVAINANGSNSSGPAVKAENVDRLPETPSISWQRLYTGTNKADIKITFTGINDPATEVGWIFTKTVKLAGWKKNDATGNGIVLNLPFGDVYTVVAMIHSNDPKKFLGTKNSSLSNSVVIKDAQVKLVGATDGKGLVYTDGQPYPPPPAPPTGFVKLDSLQLSNFDTETSARVQEVDQFGQVFFSYKGINNEPEEIIKIDSELDYEVIMQLEWPDAIHY